MKASMFFYEFIHASEKLSTILNTINNTRNPHPPTDSPRGLFAMPVIRLLNPAQAVAGGGWGGRGAEKRSIIPNTINNTRNPQPPTNSRRGSFAMPLIRLLNPAHAVAGGWAGCQSHHTHTHIGHTYFGMAHTIHNCFDTLLLITDR